MRARPAYVVTLVATAIALTLGSPHSATAVKVLGQTEIEEALTCQCGCGLTVHSCNHLQCGFAVPARQDIAESLARGETGDQILERYKKKYGEKVLSSPIPQGFNILAWIGPYAGIFVAGVLMILFFRSRARRTPDPSESLGTGSAISDPELEARRARLRREAKELEP